MKPQPKALVRNAKLKRVTGPIDYGDGLQDDREEIFIRMVCDGLPLGTAFERAGFKSTDNNAAMLLFRLPRIQDRVEAVLEARRTTGVVTLAEVTDMLKRTFAGASSREEYNAAHNAAFSLARLYGHVTDRATVEVLRRPSRDPDAPAEQALSSWVNGLPGPVIDASPLPAPAGPEALLIEPASPDARQPIEPGPGLAVDWLNGPSGLGSQQALNGPSPVDGPSLFEGLNEGPSSGSLLGSEGPGPEKRNDFNEIQGMKARSAGPGQSENGAPARAVTGTPTKRARAAPPPRGGKKSKGAPHKPKKGNSPSGAAKRKAKRMKDLFG